MITMLAATIFGLVFLAMPATGLVLFPVSSPELLLLSMPGLTRQPVRQDRVGTTTQRSLRCCCPTIMTAAPGGVAELYGSISGSSRKKTQYAIIPGQPRTGGLDQGARAGRDRDPWSRKFLRGVICRAGGGEGGQYDDGEEKKEDSAEEEEKEEKGEEKDQSIITSTGVGVGVGVGDDSSPAISFSAIENELQARSATTTTARNATGDRGRGSGGGGGGGGGVDQEENAWLPRFFPPPSPGDQDGQEDGSSIPPLVELPLDGILLQLFPALLIGVVGAFLTIAVQFEASKFDGMVGEDGAAVVVTDLRDTRTDQQP